MQLAARSFCDSSLWGEGVVAFDAFRYGAIDGTFRVDFVSLAKSWGQQGLQCIMIPDMIVKAIFLLQKPKWNGFSFETIDILMSQCPRGQIGQI